MWTVDADPGHLAEQVRTRLMRAALQAYEDASLQGLCAEGAWEAALGAMRRLDLGQPPRSFQVRPVTRADAPAWSSLRHALWPDASREELANEAEAFFGAGDPQLSAVLLAEADNGTAIGFAELSLRPYAEDCRTSPVAFLEGWYVVPSERLRGVGRALVTAAEEWGREQGCSEFASDAELENTESAAAHRALGFEDAGAIRCFRKDL
jgi:aminoglycoside 6'-N-acetyltransferase I